MSPLAYHAPSATSTTPHETYYAIDPSLDFPSHSDGHFPLIYAPSLVPPPTAAYDQGDRRIVSTASMIDHGSPPSSPLLPASASFEMSREQWLRLGGFSEPDPPPEPKPVAHYSHEPFVLSDVDAAGRTTSYSFRSLGEALAPISSSPYDLPSALPHPLPSVFEKPSTSDDILVNSPPPPTTHSALPSTRASRSPRKKAEPYKPYPTPSPAALVPLPIIPRQQESRIGTHGRKYSAAHIPRPRNAFILFRSHAVTSGLIPKNLGITDHKNISKIVAGIWKNLSVEERAAWDLAAEEEKKVHRERWPDYQYKPKTKGADGRSKAAPKKRRKVAVQEAETLFVDDGAWRVPKGKNQWSSKECELVAQAVLEGQEIGITEYVAEELDRDQREGEQSFEQSFAIMEASTSTLPPAPFHHSTLPPPPSRPSTSHHTTPTKKSAALVTPRKTRSSVQQTPKSSSPSDAHRSPSSDTSCSTTPTKHSRFARRNTGASSPGGMWRERSAQSPNSPTTSPHHSSTSPHPLSRSHPRSSAPPIFDPSTRMQRDQSYAMAQLGVSHRHDPFTAAPSPFLAGFDNSPLLGGASDRKFPLGRWELRKPSTTLSRRGLRAQEEEEAPQEGYAPEGAFASLDTRTFFDEAFGSELGSDSAWGYTQSEPVASTSNTRFVAEPTFDAFHFGEVDLFAPPPPPLARPVGKKGSAGSAGSREEGLDFGLRMDEKGSTYSGSSGYGGMSF